MFGHGSVETSSTDSISSGLISPEDDGSSRVSIALTSSSESASRIMSSSSMPMVKGGPPKQCSTGSEPNDGVTRRSGAGLDWSHRSLAQEERPMALGYDGKLYVLAFDHRGSFQKKMCGIEGEPTPEQTATIADAKHLIYEGMLEAVNRGAEASATGVLVDEQFGGDIPRDAEEKGLELAMPVEKSGQNEFDFQYGGDFGAHIEKFNPDFNKVLVRYNPDDPDTEMNERQLGRLKELADWLHGHDRKFLFELLVPATEEQLS